MDGSGSWDAIDWNQIKEPRQPRSSSQGMDEFLLEYEEVYTQGHGVVLLNTDEAGILSVTNFRLLFVSQATKGVIELGTIPLTAIEKLNDDVKLQPLPHQHDKKQPRELLQVIGKDMRVIMFAFVPKTKQKNQVLDALRKYSKPTHLLDLYAFSCDPSTVYQKSDPKMRLLKEYHRLFRKWFPHSGSEFEKDLRNEWWRVTKVNSNYSLCSTYPSALIVPRSISDEDLFQASSFRSGRRLPVISWCDPGSGAVLARSSQPLVGLMMNFRNNTDEKLVSSLCTQIIDATGSLRKLYIVDARPRANALANGAKGGGSESSSNYPRSEVLFLGIQNIHAMRDSLYRLRDYVDAHGSISSNGISSAVPLVGDRRNRGSTWGGGNLNSMTQFSSTLGEWLNHIQSILVGASWIAAQIAQESASVLVHCSDGWDRTTQLVALACLLLDPYYRTFNGFQALVEKDWLAFGHPFAERMGVPTITDNNGGSQFELLRQPSLGNLSSSPSRGALGSSVSTSNTTSGQSQTSNNCSPILLQWLDCISQLLRLYPSAFEFSCKFLVDFMDCVLSCRFGNFLCNSERERDQSGAASSCHCMWAYLADLRASGGSFHEHCNPFYDPMKHNGPLVPPAAALAPTLWPQFYLRWTCPIESQGGDLESQWHAMNKKYTVAMKAKDAAESRAKDIKTKMESMQLELHREKRASSSALAIAQRSQRESVAIRKAVRSLGCTVNFAMNESQLERAEGLTYSFRRETDTEPQQDKSPDFSVSITAIEDSLVSETPSNHICESLCPFRTREGCRWPDAACAQLGSQFVGLKANFDAFDRLSVQDSYFGSE
ncbi:phosphatidylinositol-3-phosphatase myotubularin-1-like [Oryza brachyantha]|uniref:Myotubularin phosphatase domain-containing protein n=1 Tax=Oryza brachyantha TaxID=4533 RepID=J3MV82_ORYBR|nr:phosphatidylinositol-3-phosphatase myotubularin-1-like [Oryza brachyantha]